MLLLVICDPSRAQSATNTVVIIKSSDNSYFSKTIDTLSKHVVADTEFEAILVGEEAVAQNPKLYIALGQQAADSLANIAENVPVINAYLTLEQFQNLPQNRGLTVLLDQPLERYLAFSKLTLQVDSIGIITEKQIQLNSSQQELLENLDLSLEQHQVTADQKLLPTLRGLLDSSDALLMLPRQSIYNRDSLKGVLLTSYRGGKPVISYSSAHVRSGALASIYSSPIDIGRHISLLMNSLLQNEPPEGPKFHFARFYTITFNSRVASALDLTLPGKSAIRQQLDRLSQ